MTTPTHWGVRRMWGLKEMMNFVLSHYLSAIKFLESEMADCRMKSHANISEALLSQEDVAM